MPPVDFPFELKLDGQSYRARRLHGTRQYTATFLPQVRGQQAQVQLDPTNTTDWGDGRGWGQRVDTSEGMIMPGAEVTSVGLPVQPGADLEQFAEQDGHLYVVGGRYAYRVANGSDPPVQDQDLGAGYVAVGIVPWKSSLIVSGRGTGNLWEKPSGGAWTNAMAGGPVQRGKLTTVWWNTGAGNALRLVGEGASPTALTYVAGNPRLDSDWVAPIVIGSYPIRSMVATRYHAYVGATGGLFDFGSDGTAPNLTPDVEKLVLDANGRATLSKDGWVYVNGGYTLYRVRAIGAAGDAYGLPQECGWSAQLPKQCPMAGYVTALAKHGPWLWAAIYDGANTWLCKAREATSGDVYGPLVWFVAPIYVPGAKVTALWTSGLVSLNPRLWMGVTSGGLRELRWAHLPLDSAYRDLRQARAYRFTTSAQYDEPEEIHGSDAFRVFLREIVLETENTSGAIQDALSLAKDGEATFAQVGLVRSSPRTMIHPPQTILANRYILRHTLAGTPVTPPIVTKRSTRVIPRPDLLEVRAYQIVLGPAVRSGDGALDGRSLTRSRRVLARLQRVGPVALRDELGAALQVFVAAGETFTELEATLGDAHERRVLTADFQAAVLSASGGTTWRWGDGTVYGEDRKVWA
jgi:hypothetical protein